MIVAAGAMSICHNSEKKISERFFMAKLKGTKNANLLLLEEITAQWIDSMEGTRHVCANSNPGCLSCIFHHQNKEMCRHDQL
jgi:hypothetical protein